jgi:hypothetical protein
MTRKEMHRHVLDLLERYDIIYSWCRRHTEARAVFLCRDLLGNGPSRDRSHQGTPPAQPGYSGARAVGLALGKRECADLDAGNGEELQRLLGLVRSAAGALVIIGKGTDRLSKAAFNKATEFADYLTAWMNAQEAACR